MTHPHLQPFISEPLSEYKVFRAKQVAEGLVITLARLAPLSPLLAWRTVVIPNGATYREGSHVGCAVFNINGYDERGNPGEASRWLHKALCAPAQRRYRYLVRDVWQCFSRHQVCVVDAMATRSGIVALTYGDDPTHLALRKTALNDTSDPHIQNDRIIGECSVQFKPHIDLKASDFQLGHDMYEHVISSVKSSSNDLMHLPTFRLGKSALEHCMHQGETSQLLELIEQSTAIESLDITNRSRYRSTLEMAARWDREVQVFQALLEKGANIWIDDDPQVGAMATVVRRKNLDALHLLISADKSHDMVRWWERFGVLMCKLDEFPEGADLLRAHLAQKAAQEALTEITGCSMRPTTAT